MDDRPDQQGWERVDAALAQLKLAHSQGQAGAGLEARILARVGETRQRRRLPYVPGPWRVGWPVGSGLVRVGRAGTVSLLAVLLIALIGPTLLAPRPPGPAPGGIRASAAASSEVPATAEVPVSNPPHIRGTCPLTPTTRLAGGSAPEVDVSGLRWRWGGVPWVAGSPEKVVWLADSGAQPTAGVSVYAVRLDLPILVGGHPAAFSGAASHDIYAAAIDAGWADLLQLPAPGCWLLTAVWSDGASSVVVAAAPPTGMHSPAPSSTASPVPSTPLATCPATPPSPIAPPQGWPGPAYVDGPFRWLLPKSQTWRFGGAGDKLVLDSQVGWDIGDMRIIAIPLVRAGGVGWLRVTAVAGDIPPGFGGGTLGVGVTLPARNCWAFTYVASEGTSTIVDDLRPQG